MKCYSTSTNTIRSAARLRFRASSTLHPHPHPSIHPHPHPSARSAFTLIELLVVIMVLVLMTSALVPVLSSASDARRAREGARMVSTVFASAQTQAQVSGRSAGVLIQRLKSSSSGAAVNSAAAMDLFMAESPPPYIGDALNSTASVMGATVTFTGANLGNANVQSGDLIRLSYRGEIYQLSGVSGNSATISPLDTTQAYPPPGNLPFQIYRRPVKTLAAPVQLTEGVAIDLNFSGIDFNSTGTNFNTTFGPASSTSDAGQIIVTFAPTGALDLIYIVPSAGGQAQVIRPIQGVALLVGKVEKIQTPPATAVTPQNPSPLNWLDMDSRWVAIARQPGMVTTAEVAATPPPPTGNVIMSLRLVRGSQNMVGN